jgi:hypothetical protein
LKFKVPPDIEVKLAIGADSQGSTFPYKIEDELGELQFSWGPMGSHGSPPEEWVLESTHLEVKVLLGGKYQWASYKGTLSKGKYWHFAGMVGEQVYYYNASERIADKFDNIISNACVQASNR